MRKPKHLTPPDWLKDEAVELWKRHAQALHDTGMLSERDVDAWSMTCEIYRMLRQCEPTRDSKEAIRYNGLQKLFMNYCKQFGLLPKDRKSHDLEPELDIATVLGKKMERR